MNTILANLVDQTIEQIAELLVKEHANIFAKKMTKAALVKILKSSASPAKTKKVVEDVVDETEDDDAADESGDAVQTTDHPEGWTADEWTKFTEQIDSLEDGHLLSVTTCKSNNGKKKSGLVIDEKYHLCAKKGEEEALQTVVDFLNAQSGDAESESLNEGGDDDEESGDESENDFVDGFDAKKLSALKKAIEKAEDGDYINIATNKKVKKSAANEKKMVFDDDLKMALPKLANDKEQKAYIKRVKKMVA